jgi:hypothetical protein
MKNRISYLLIPGITLLHLVVSGMVIMLAAGASVSRVENGGARPGLAEILSSGLLYPIFIPANAVLGNTSGTVSWMLLIGNSLAWALAASLVIRLVARQRARRDA